MENKNAGSQQSTAVYYQFRPELGYPIFLQFSDVDLEKEMQFIIHEVGFVLSKKESLDQACKERKFRLLRLSAATPKVLKKITSYSEHAFGLGQEVVENFGYYEVYVMMRHAIMIMSQSSSHWEMAFDKEKVFMKAHEQSTQANIRLCINRFLSSALSFMEVLCFWGTMKNKSVIISQQLQSANTCVYIDINKNRAFTNAQIMAPLDKTPLLVSHDKMRLLKEELFSILASRILYFSSGQIPKAYMVQQLTQLVRTHFQISSANEEMVATS